MKENIERNEHFYNLHFQYQKEGLTLSEIRNRVKADMGIANDHHYRARLSSLANEKKYDGKYVALREFMKRQPKAVKTAEVKVVAEQAVEQQDVKETVRV